MFSYVYEVILGIVDILGRLSYTLSIIAIVVALVMITQVVSYYSKDAKAKRKRLEELEYECSRLYLYKNAEQIKEMAIDECNREFYMSSVIKRIDEKIKDSLLHNSSPEIIKDIVSDIENEGIYFGSRLHKSYASGYLNENDLLNLVKHVNSKGYDMTYTKSALKLGLLMSEVLHTVDISISRKKENN